MAVLAEMKTPHIWVIELRCSKIEPWDPCVPSFLTRDEAVKAKERWIKDGIGYDYRVRKYVREGKK